MFFSLILLGYQIAFFHFIDLVSCFKSYVFFLNKLIILKPIYEITFNKFLRLMYSIAFFSVNKWNDLFLFNVIYFFQFICINNYCYSCIKIFWLLFERISNLLRKAWKYFRKKNYNLFSFKIIFLNYSLTKFFSTISK